MVAKKKSSSRKPLPVPTGKAISATGTRNAKLVSALKKNPNKPGPLDDMGRALKSLVVIDVPREKRTPMPKKKK